MRLKILPEQIPRRRIDLAGVDEALSRPDAGCASVGRLRGAPANLSAKNETAGPSPGAAVLLNGQAL